MPTGHEGDHYLSMTALLKEEPSGNYTFDIKITASLVAILAPHGGDIEPGTDQIASAVAADQYRLFCFKGHRTGGQNRLLHVTSHKYDEPQCRGLIAPCEVVVAIHGCADRSPDEEVYLGGRETGLRETIGEELRKADFKVPPSFSTPDKFKAQHRENICNMGQSRAGAQLELSRSFRRGIVQGGGQRSERFRLFVDAIVGAIEAHRK